MQAIDKPFSKIINGAMQFVIPVFQRDYSWTEEDCAQLLDDIVSIAKDDSERGHFIGSVVYIATGDISPDFTRWLLIDGQQRITTLTLLMTALRDHIRKTGWTGGDKSPTAKRVEAYFLKNLQEEGNDEHKLVLRRHDQETLRCLLNGEVSEGVPSERIKENYEYFLGQLEHLDPDEVYQGVGRLVLVDVRLHRGIDDPQLIFESLNSTGKDLSQADLIRNFILMRLEEEEQTKFYQKYWAKIETLYRTSEKAFDAFARDYVALKTQASKQEKASEVYQAFRRVFSELKRELGGLEAVLIDMLRHATYHAAFSLDSNAYPQVAEELANLRKLVDVPATLVMQLFDRFDRLKTLSDQNFRHALRLLESFVLRRAICGTQTRGYWSIFAGLAYRVSETEPLTSLKIGLSRLAENYRFPSDSEFRRNLMERELFGMRICHFLLDRLENFDTNEPTETSGYSIEHILPQNKNLSAAWKNMLGDEWQSVQQLWLHRLGNLTLTGYNSKYSDRPFQEKKSIQDGFNDSAVRLNKFVREQTCWTAVEIAERGEILADRAVDVWPALEVDQAALDAAEVEELHRRAAKKDVSDVVMSELASQLYSGLRPLMLNLDEKVVEIAESKSISFHSPSFFAEVLPRTSRLVVLLPVEFSEIDDPAGVALDASARKFFTNAKYDGGVVVRIDEFEQIDNALDVIRQAHTLANA